MRMEKTVSKFPSKRNERATAATQEFRIIGGEFRGRRLSYPGNPGLRPMKDRTREALFNRLRNFIEGAHAIDLFAGTGAVGLEALSRGAGSMIAFENHTETARSLRKNIEKLGVTDRTRVVCGDVFPWAAQSPMGLENPTQLDSQTPWCVFCCPPYEFYRTREAEMLELITQMVARSPIGSVIVVESDLEWQPVSMPSERTWESYGYAPAVLRILWPENA